MVYLILIRTCSDSERTLGTLYIYNDDSLLGVLKTLELPWLNNQRRISCIPEGIYDVRENISKKFGWSLWLQNVPNRSEILIHIGNFTRQILGCILVGLYHSDIDGDGITDVVSSGQAMKILEGHVRGSHKVTLIII